MEILALKYIQWGKHSNKFIFFHLSGPDIITNEKLNA